MYSGQNVWSNEAPHRGGQMMCSRTTYSAMYCVSNGRLVLGFRYFVCLDLIQSTIGTHCPKIYTFSITNAWWVSNSPMLINMSWLVSSLLSKSQHRPLTIRLTFQEFFVVVLFLLLLLLHFVESIRLEACCIQPSVGSFELRWRWSGGNYIQFFFLNVCFAQNS